MPSETTDERSAENTTEKERQRCQATTRSGDRCKRKARQGSRFCATHDLLADSTTAPNGAGQADDPPESDASEQPSDDEVRRQLAGELERPIDELQESSPEFSPPPFSPQALLATVK